MATCRSRYWCTRRDGMERESTENRAGRIVSRRRVNPIFLVPPTCVSSLSFSLFPVRLLRVFPLLRTSLREDLVILVPDFIFGRCWVSDPEPSPLDPRRWQTPLKAILHVPALRDSTFYSTSLGAAPVNFIQYHILTEEDTSYRKISRLVSRLRTMHASVRFIRSELIFYIFGYNIFIFDSWAFPIFVSKILAKKWRACKIQIYI